MADSESDKKLVEHMASLGRPLRPRPADVKPRLRALRGIKAVFFDVYGTLLVGMSHDGDADRTAARAAHFLTALNAAGFRVVHPEAVSGPARLSQLIRIDHEEKHAAGTDYPEVDAFSIWRDALSALLREKLVEGELNEHAIRLAAVTYECLTNPTWPMPMAQKTLKDLRARGTILGITSNAQFYTPLALEALFRRPLNELGFDARLCVWSFQLLQAKPSDELFGQAAALLRTWGDLAPFEAIVVGNDEAKDVVPARRAGFRTALFAGDRESYRPLADDPEAGKADLVITSLSQLVDGLA